MMKQFRKITVICLFIMALTAFKTTDHIGTCWLGSCPATIGIGWPQPFLVWKTEYTKAPRSAVYTKNISLKNLNQIEVGASATGLILDLILWGFFAILTHEFFSIKFLYKNVLKKIFFMFDPHLIHDLMLKTGSFLGSFAITRSFTSLIFNYKNPKLENTVFGLKFVSPVGLSAGFDKDAVCMPILPSIGMGFESAGSVTLNSYEGNPKPWIVRLPKSQAILVNYGLKNIGIKPIIERIKTYLGFLGDFKIFISVAKTNCKETAEEKQGIADYCESLTILKETGIGDVYEINISCPNAYGGEPFTTPEKLNNLFSEITTLHLEKPIIVKMPINYEFEEYKKMLDVLLKFNVAGVVIGNLNKKRDPEYLKDEIPATLKGNLSGLPTKKLSNYLIGETYKYCGERLKIIGVGGIFSAEDAYEKIKLGSSLVELITGLIYEGPQLVKEINEGIIKLMEKDGYTNINQAIGSAFKK